MEGVDPQDIPQLVEDMEQKPRVILCTISTVADAAIQKQIRRLPIRTICLDEVQVMPATGPESKASLISNPKGGQL